MANVKFTEVTEKFTTITGTKDEDGNIVYLINGKVWCRDWQLPIEVLEEKKPGKYIKDNAKEVKFSECVHKAMDTATDPISGETITFKTDGTQRKLIDIIFDGGHSGEGGGVVPHLTFSYPSLSSHFGQVQNTANDSNLQTELVSGYLLTADKFLSVKPFPGG